LSLLVTQLNNNDFVIKMKIMSNICCMDWVIINGVITNQLNVLWKT